MKKYRVTKHFIGGLLKGLTDTEITPVRFHVGFVCKHPSGGSPYKVTAVEEVPEVPEPEQPAPEAVVISGEIATVEGALSNPDDFVLSYDGLLGPTLRKGTSDFSTAISEEDFDRILQAMRDLRKALLVMAAHR